MMTVRQRRWLAASLATGEDVRERQSVDFRGGVAEQFLGAAIDLLQGAADGVDEEEGVAGVVEKMAVAALREFGIVRFRCGPRLPETVEVAPADAVQARIRGQPHDRRRQRRDDRDGGHRPGVQPARFRGRPLHPPSP